VGLGTTDLDFTITNTVEIIDLASNTSVCPKLVNFPNTILCPYGGLGYQNEPMICGGIDNQNQILRDCYIYVNGRWSNYNGEMSERGAFWCSWLEKG